MKEAGRVTSHETPKGRCRINSIWPQKGPLRNRCLVRYGGTSFGCSLSAPSRFSVAVPLRRAKSGRRLTHHGRDEQGLPSFVLARAERRGACSMQIRVEGDRETNGLQSSSLRFSDSTRLIPAWQFEGCEPYGPLRTRQKRVVLKRN